LSSVESLFTASMLIDAALAQSDEICYK
jgi:hypothetical protein